MRRSAAAIGFALSAVVVWSIMGLVAVLVHAIFAPAQPPRYRITWLVK